MVEAEDSCGEVTYFTHAQEISEIVHQVEHSDSAKEILALYPRFRSVMETYQENSQLLDPNLHEIVAPLAKALRRANPFASQTASTLVNENSPQQQTVDTQTEGRLAAVGKLLWVVASVRGPKTIIKLFPHEAANLEPTIYLLLALQKSEWEVQCVLLLWLSQLITLPFSLELLDSSLSASSGHTSSQGCPPLVQKLLDRSKQCLEQPGSMREMAAKLLGRLLTRPDTETALRDFLQWAILSTKQKDRKAIFLIPGCLQALSEILGCSSRPAMLNFVRDIWQALLTLFDKDLKSQTTLTRKLIMKLVQRLTLVTLPPPSTFDDFEVPEELEDAIECLLTGLCDVDTIVRWSSAKGLGRITSRLPRELGNEIVGNVLELIEDELFDTAWHGACLCLAELARRACLPQSRFHQMAPLIAKALQFDIRRGPHSIGAHIRDAAAYVCWALSRAYDAETVQPLLKTLSPALLTTACYDREVNCRRAASAAFQEIVGRQASFPHGIEILTAADYFTLSSKSTAYLEVALQVAEFPEYRSCMRQHLLVTKLRHWELAVRELASKALAALVPLEPAEFSGQTLEYLLDHSMDRTLEVRHGAVLGAAENLLACQQHKVLISENTVDRIKSLPGSIETDRLLLGKGGDLMRCAVCRYIACVALSSIALEESEIATYKSIILKCISNVSSSVQQQAVGALRAFGEVYVRDSSQSFRLVEGLLADLKQQSAPVRRGAALALGVLPSRIILPSLAPVIDSLITATQVEALIELRDEETRVHAVNALVSVLLNYLQSAVPIPSRASSANLTPPHVEDDQAELANLEAKAHANSSCGPSGSLNGRNACDESALQGSEQPQEVQQTIVTVLDALIGAMKDYTINNRGDVGSWVREAAMKGLVKVLAFLLSTDELNSERIQIDLLQQYVQTVLGLLLQQAVERIARMRETAVTQARTLLDVLPKKVQVAAVDEVLSALAPPSDSSLASYQVLNSIARLLRVRQYREQVLTGLVFSIGGIDAPLAEAACKALCQQLHTEAAAVEVFRSLLVLWKRQVKSNRMAVPLLKTTDVILSHTSDDNALLQNQFAGELMELVGREVRNCKNVAKLTSAATVLCHLVHPHCPAKVPALTTLLQLLVSEMPRVRHAVAEQLYMHMITQEDAGLSEDVANVLLETAWNDDFEASKAAQAQIKQHMGVI